jgi:hypothetical protein
MAQKKKGDRALTVHGLLGSLSYWGTTARFLLVSILIWFAFFVNILSVNGGTSYVDGEIFMLIYGLATLFILDLGYVIAARALPLNKMADRWIVMMSDVLLAATFIVPSLVSVAVDGNKLRAVSLVGVLLIVSIRILIGLLYAKRK